MEDLPRGRPAPLDGKSSSRSKAKKRSADGNGVGEDAPPPLFGAALKSTGSASKNAAAAGGDSKRPKKRARRSSASSKAAKRKSETTARDSDDSNSDSGSDGLDDFGAGEGGAGSSLVSSADGSQAPRPLNYGTIAVGMSLIGAVRRVVPGSGRMVAEISLPGEGNMRGQVSIADVSDVLAQRMERLAAADENAAAETLGIDSILDVLNIGELVRCVVTSLESVSAAPGAENDSARLSIRVSTRASAVNDGLESSTLYKGMLLAASVKSIEDHGYVIECGISGVEAFLPTKLAATGVALRVGQPITVSLAEIKEGSDKTKKGVCRRIITVTNDPAAFSRAPADNGLDVLKQLKAGTAVTARVTRVLGTGIIATCLGYFSGYVDSLNVANFVGVQPVAGRGGPSSAWLSDMYSDGQRLRARVLWVDPMSKSIGLTVRKHLMEWRPFRFGDGKPLDDEDYSSSDDDGSPASPDHGVDPDQASKQRPSPSHPVRVGDFLDGLQVTRVIRKLGVMLTVSPTEGADQPLVFVHFSNLADNASTALLKKFKPGSESLYRVRVLGLDRLHGVITATMRASHLETEILTIDDILPGMIVNGTVREVHDTGVIVAITNHIGGRFNKLHMGDSGSVGGKSSSYDLKKKFHPGQKVRTRVLTVEADTHRVNLTHKRTMVKSEDATIVDYEHVVPGVIAHGFVINVAEAHILVQFYGGVVGLVSIADVPHALADMKNKRNKQSLQSLLGMFRIGQVLRTKVVSVDADAKKMRLTLDLTADVQALLRQVRVRSERALRSKTQSADESALAAILTVLDTQSSDVLARDWSNVAHCWNSPKALGLSSAVDVVLSHVGDKDNILYFKVSHKTADTLSGPVWASMPWQHIADNLDQSKAVRDALAAKLAASNAGSRDIAWAFPCVVLVRRTPSDIVTLEISSKLSLVRAAAAGQLLSSASDALAGSTVMGFVRAVEDYGVYVQFANNVVGMAHKSDLGDAMVEDPHDYFETGQTVRAYITETGMSKTDGLERRIKLSLKPSLCRSADPFILESFLAVQDVFSVCALRGDVGDAVDWSKFSIGYDIDATVKVVKPFGTLFTCSLDPRVSAFALTKHTTALQAGEQRSVRVLDVNPTKYILDVDAVAAKAARSRKAQPPRPSSVVEGTIALVKQNYVVVRLPSNSGAIVFAPVHDWNQVSTFSAFNVFSIGQSVRVQVHGTDPAPTAVARTLATIVGDAAAAHAGLSRRKAVGAHFEGMLAEGDEVCPGDFVRVKVLQIAPMYIIVAINETTTGRIHITDVADEIDGISPLQGLRVGSIVDARVLIVRQITSNHKKLAITHRNNSTSRLSIRLSMKPSVLAIPKGDPLPAETTLQTLTRGALVNGVIQSVTVDALWISVSSSARGRVFVLDATDDVTDLALFTERFRVGEGVRCRVLNVNSKNGQLDLSIKAAQQPKFSTAPKRISVGDLVTGRIAKIVDGVGLNIQIGAHEYGRVFITDVSDCYSRQRLSQRFSEWQPVRCMVLSVQNQSSPQKQSRKSLIDLSMRTSVIAPDEWKRERAAADERDLEVSLLDGERWQPVIGSVDDLEVGQRVAGFVTRASGSGCIVTLGRGISTFVPTAHLSDAVIRNPTRVFQLGRMVYGAITAVDVQKKSFTLSLKKSQTEPTRKRIHLSDVQIGNIVRGVVKSVVDSGVFIRIEHSSFDAFVHVSMLSDGFVKSSADCGLSVGDSVKCAITAIEPARRRVSGSLRKSDLAAGAGVLEEHVEKGEDADDAAMEDAYFSDSSSSSDSGVADDDMADSGEESDGSISISEAEHNETNLDDQEIESEQSSSDDVEDTRTGPVVQWSRKARAESSDDASGDSESDDVDLAAGKSAKKRDARRRAAEKSVAVDVAEQHQQALVEGVRGPETAADFEKVLMANPASSVLWVQYMALYLSLSQPDRARAIAVRALKVIPQADISERRNIWVARLNLEHEYGNHDSLNEMFERACQFNDVKDMFIQLAELYDHSGRDEERAAATWVTITKKFGTSARVWRKYIGFLCRHGRLDEFRAELDRSLQALPKRKHAEIIVHAAVCEFRWGTAERGRTLFEGVVQAYPSRIDAWSVWLDQELRPAVLASADHARNVFERVTVLNLSTKKMKYFFKRWLKFEREHGTEGDVEHVKDRAASYVESKMKA